MSPQPPAADDGLDLRLVDLLMHAIRREGGEPIVISHADYWALPDAERNAQRYVVLMNDTYERWVDR